jgi:hypothetical protein
MKVYAPMGEEAFDDLPPTEEPPAGASSRNCSTHSPLKAGEDLAAVLQALEISAATLRRWRTGRHRAAVAAAG